MVGSIDSSQSSIFSSSRPSDYREGRPSCLHCTEGVGHRVYSPRGREERISDIHHQVWLGTFKTKISARENKRLISTIWMTCTVKSPLVQGLHQAKVARPVETWARFLSISLTLIEFFSSIYFYCISGSGHGDPHFICCMPYIVPLWVIVSLVLEDCNNFYFVRK